MQLVVFNEENEFIIKDFLSNNSIGIETTKISVKKLAF